MTKALTKEQCELWDRFSAAITAARDAYTELEDMLGEIQAKGVPRIHVQNKTGAVPTAKVPSK